MITTKLLGALVFASAASLGVAGCASNVADEEAEPSESDLSGSRSVTLKYEGTCDFLRDCSKFSKGLPAGKVNWGCTGVGVCSDSASWVAGPNRSYCGKTVKFCKGARCTTAVVKDVSISGDWEGSNGVLDALGLTTHGMTGKCSGFGGGKVTVSVGGSDTSEPPESDSKEDSTPSSSSDGEPDDRDDGCFSATLQKDVSELTCVQSRKTKLFYQCKSGKWYRGVEGKTGPYGECRTVHPL